MATCPVPHCSSNNKMVQFFKFPINQERRRIWAEKCGITNLGSKVIRICELHFDDSQYEHHRKNKLSQLKPNAIPTLRLPRYSPELKKPKVSEVNQDEKLRYCRTCASKDQGFVPIFAKDSMSYYNLYNMIETYLPIKVTKEDKLPLQVCQKCYNTLKAWDDLIGDVLFAERRLRKILFRKKPPSKKSMAPALNSTANDTAIPHPNGPFRIKVRDFAASTIPNDFNTSDGEKMIEPIVDATFSEELEDFSRNAFSSSGDECTVELFESDGGGLTPSSEIERKETMEATEELVHPECDLNSKFDVTRSLKCYKRIVARTVPNERHGTPSYKGCASDGEPVGYEQAYIHHLKEQFKSTTAEENAKKSEEMNSNQSTESYSCAEISSRPCSYT